MMKTATQYLKYGTLGIALMSTLSLGFTGAQNSSKNISIADFEAYMIDDVAFVTWTTSAEAHNEEVTLEKSTNGHKFRPVKKFQLNGSGSKYTFVDEEPSYGLSYYRIKHRHHRPFENVAHLINHDGPIHFEVSAENNVIELKADHRSDKTYLVSVADKTGKLYFLESMVFTSTEPVKIYLKKLAPEKQEFIVHLHSTEWSTDKIVAL